MRSRCGRNAHRGGFRRHARHSERRALPRTAERDLSRDARRQHAIRPALTSIRTVRGRASVDWARSGAGLRLTVEVPVGAEAEVHVPATRRSDAPQGADFVRSEPGYVVYSVPHGNWEFTATALTG
jgi:hypothetical protein